MAVAGAAKEVVPAATRAGGEVMVAEVPPVAVVVMVVGELATAVKAAAAMAVGMEVGAAMAAMVVKVAERCISHNSAPEH